MSLSIRLIKGRVDFINAKTILIYELFIFLMVGIALLIAMCFKSLASMSTATIGFSSVGCIIGGAWFPVNDSLGFISNCAKLFPQYWFMNAIRNGKSEEWFDEVAALPNSGGMSIVILVLFMLLVYLISAVIFARKSD